MSAIPGVMAFLRPFPVLEISTGATNQNQGQYAFSISGVNPDQVYDAGAKLLAKMHEFPGFLTVSSDYFNNTPNLDIDLRREEAKIHGVSEARILTLLRNAYSQNYLYLIKKPADQYQVILEAEDSARAQPEDLALLYIRSDDGKRLVPLNALRDLEIDHRAAGGQPSQPVHQRHAVLQSQARRRHRRRHRAHQQSRRRNRAAVAARESAGRSADVPKHGARPDRSSWRWRFSSCT